MEAQGNTIAIITSIRINSGSGFRMLALAKYLARQGNRVFLTGIGKPVNEVEGVSYRAISGPPWLPFLALAALIVNLRSLFSWRPAYIIVSKPLPPSILPAVFYRFIARVTVILDYDDVEHDYWRHVPLYRRILRLTERFAVKRADIITTHSTDLSRYLTGDLRVPENKVWFLPQGVDVELFSGCVGDQALRRSLQLEGKIVIVYAAHFNVAVRDFDFILQMTARLSRVVPDAVLLVIGDGPGCAAYRRQAVAMGIGDIVRFAGYVPHGEIGKYFAVSHVAINYLSPTPANVCRASIKLREYLFCGLHVVCNDVSEDTRQFKEYVLTFPSGDLEGFCAQVAEAVGHARAGRNTAAAAFVAQQFSWTYIAASFHGRLKSSGGVE